MPTREFKRKSECVCNLRAPEQMPMHTYTRLIQWSENPSLLADCIWKASAVRARSRLYIANRGRNLFVYVYYHHIVFMCSAFSHVSWTLRIFPSVRKLHGKQNELASRKAGQPIDISRSPTSLLRLVMCLQNRCANSKRVWCRIYSSEQSIGFVYQNLNYIWYKSYV